MYKIIACDLDETLISRDRSISKENIEAIQRAKQAGVRFVPATGRGYNSVRNELKTLGLYDLENEYVISYNGGAITENKDERVLHFQGITFKEAQDLYIRGLSYDHICIHIYTPDQVWVRNFYPEEVEYLACRQPCTEIFGDDIEFLKEKEIVKAIYMNTDYDYLRKIQSQITDLTMDLDVSFSSNRYMEFNRKGVSKGKGLHKLADLLGVDIRDTIAIGDNYNDLSMIKEAGLGVGVANTVEAMKKECDYITKADCDHSAIAEVINRFIFNEGN
ncbi:MAG: Cof-type HAD-IIB family hydrolase [Bulleidia sp.]|mgnify:FL=1|nr:Cof-type HAD-IIB family hydrolase [Bulleidia sp.]HAW13314.1 Cof-type HAD-IIB family hydrolase [Erysipelotrichaceae bacterium]